MDNSQVEAPTKTEDNKLVGADSQRKAYKINTKLAVILKMISLLLGILEYISPRLAGWWAMRMWLATHRHTEPAREKRWCESAQVSELAHEYGPIKLYQWQQQQTNTSIETPIHVPRVLLIHGWNGRGLQLAGFVQPLLKQGFQVISFDAPGHGRSPGNDSNLLRIADVVEKIEQSIGPIDSIIGHSFGAMVMAKVAQRGLKIRTAVAISAPKDADFLVNLFCTMLKINPNTKTNLLTRIIRRFGDDVFSRISTIQNLKQLTIQGLIVHDLNDPDIPVTHAQELQSAWVNSEILITENLGHQRLLRNKKVIDSIVEFIVTQK